MLCAVSTLMQPTDSGILEMRRRQEAEEEVGRGQPALRAAFSLHLSLHPLKSGWNEKRQLYVRLQGETDPRKRTTEERKAPERKQRGRGNENGGDKRPFGGRGGYHSVYFLLAASQSLTTSANETMQTCFLSVSSASRSSDAGKKGKHYAPSARYRGRCGA